MSLRCLFVVSLIDSKLLYFRLVNDRGLLMIIVFILTFSVLFFCQGFPHSGMSLDEKVPNRNPSASRTGPVAPTVERARRSTTVRVPGVARFMQKEAWSSSLLGPHWFFTLIAVLLSSCYRGMSNATVVRYSFPRSTYPHRYGRGVGFQPF